MNIKLFNDEVLTPLLPYVLDKEEVTPQFVEKSSEETRAAMTALGLIKRTKDEIVILRNNKNMILTDHKNFYDFKDQIENWIKSDFELDLSKVTNTLEGYTLLKVSGDEYGVILDSTDNLVLYVKHIQDSRSPWVKIPGDSRRHVLGFVTVEPPQPNGFQKKISGWSKKFIKPKISVTTYRDLRVSDFSIIGPYIRENVLGFSQVEDLRKPNKTIFGLRARRSFINTSRCEVVYDKTIDDKPICLSIDKNIGSTVGNISINGDAVGNVELIQINSTEFKTKINKLDSFNGNWVDLVNACNEAISYPVLTGKKQFQQA